MKKINQFFTAALAAISILLASEVVMADGTASVPLRPAQIDISTATSESAVLVTLSGYSTDQVRYRLYSGTNQYNCWDAVSGQYITSNVYANNPLVIGDPTTTTTFWILFQRGSNASTAASYRDRVAPYNTNNNTVALPSASEITNPKSITHSDVTFSTWSNYSVKYVIVGYDAVTGGNLISATSSALASGNFNLIVNDGTVIRRIEVRSVNNTLIESVTGTWPDQNTVATPIFSPNGGTFYDPVDVTITSATEGATIYYSLQSSTGPWTTYTAPVNISQNSTIWAYATAAGLDNSSVASATFTFAQAVNIANIATLRNSPTGTTVYKLTGEAILTFQQTFRGQKFIQDNTAGIMIDDENGIITTPYNLYDGIAGITGTLSAYGNMLQFIPVVNSGAATSSNNIVEPIVISLNEFNSNFMNYQSRLVTLVDILFDVEPGTNFANGEVYSITDGETTADFRTTFYDVDYINTQIPTVNFTITGLPNSRSEGDFITSRFLDDFTFVSANASLSVFTLGEINVLDLPGIVVDNPNSDVGAILYVEDFTDFAGIVAEPTHENATVTIAVNDNIVSPGDLDTQPLEPNDVIVATVVAEDGETTMFYKVTTVIDNRELILTSPLGGETVYAGDEAVITWTSAIITHVNLWAYDAENEQLHLLNEAGPIPAAVGSYSYTIPNGTFGDFYIRITDAADPLFFDQTESPVSVIDELYPSIISRYPAHQSQNISLGFTLFLRFDEDIDTGTGSFKINQLSDDTEVMSFTAADFSIVEDKASLVVQYLEFSTAYYITADEGIFEDISGNPSPAITKSGAVQWHITTMDEPDTDLFFSEYIEGSGNNKALEIYNPRGMVVNLDSYRIAQSSNGGGWLYYHYFPEGATIAPDDVWVIITDAVNPSLFNPDDADEVLAYPSVVHHTGNDARAIERTDNGTDYYIVDVFGDPNSSNDFDVAGVTAAAKDHTLVRKSSVSTGNTNWAASAGTNVNDSEWEIYPMDTFDYLGWHFAGLNNAAEILSFTVENQMGNTTINSTQATVTLKVLNGTNLNTIIPMFTLSSGATAFVNGVEQVPGTSMVNFTNPVIYTIVAEDGETQRDWTVTITEAAISNEAEILNFVVENQMGDALINSTNATVTVTVAAGTDVTNLTPSITISLGATINPGGGIPQNFTNPVEYTVTAQDQVTQKVWTVTVNAIILTPIYDIQYTEDESGNSPYAGEVVITSGVVTALHYDYVGGTFQGIFLQDGSGAWNGLYAYDRYMNPVPEIGDSILIKGMIKEMYGVTEITFDNTSGTDLEIYTISSGNDLPAPYIVSTLDANGEPWESVLIKVKNAQCTDPNAGYGMAEVNDGSGPLLVDDDMYQAELILNERYDIVGVGYYSYNQYKILPRSAADVQVPQGVIISWGQNIQAYPNPFNNAIWIDSAHDVARINIYNLIGQHVMSINHNGTERVSIQTEGLPSGVYIVTLMNTKGETTVRKMIKSKN